MAISIDRPIICPILIGRLPHLDLLGRFLADVSAGHGHTVPVTGEAGIGKSRLVAEVQRLAVQQRILVVRGICFESDRSLPYAPIVDLLRAFCTSHSPTEIGNYLGPAGPDLIKIVPDIGAWLGDVIPSALLDPEQEKRRLFHALTQVVTRLAARQPLLVVVEDLHWSDDTSLDFLLHLARAITLQRIGLLMTYRSDEVSPPLEHMLAELDRTRLASELSLAPLDADEVDAMLHAIFALERPPHAGFRDAIYDLTGGNPFFIEEVLRSLITAGDIYFSGGSWNRKVLDEMRIPRTIRDAVQRRRGELSPTADHVLDVAAVAGQRFDFAVLQYLTHLDDDQALHYMKELLAAQLVSEQSSEQCVFRHALTRQAVYTSLFARERKMLHRQVAEAIESVYAAALDAHLTDLAYHYYEAGVWDKALDYARQAGKRALTLHAPRAAVEHLSRALDALTRLDLAPLPDLHRVRGQAYETLGNWDDACADYTAALEATRAVGDRQAEWESLLDLGMLWAGRDYAQTGLYYCRAFDLARAMDEPALIAHSSNHMGNWHLNVDQTYEARHYHQQALEIFKHLDDRPGIAATLDFLGMTYFLSSDLV